MKRDNYVGMDVHQSMTVVAVMNAEGKIVLETMVPMAASRIRELIESLSGPLHVTLEEGPQAEWLHELIRDLVKSPSSAGISPLSRFPRRSSSVTRPFPSVPTTCQSEMASLVNQFVLVVQFAPSVMGVYGLAFYLRFLLFFWKLAYAVTVHGVPPHPICQEELNDPGRDVSINSNKDSILTLQRPIPVGPATSLSVRFFPFREVTP